MKRKETNEAIGICGFVKRDYLPHADIGFTHLSFTEIVAIIFSMNIRSHRLLSKLGFIETGQMESGNNQPQTPVFSIKRNRYNNL